MPSLPMPRPRRQATFAQNLRIPEGCPAMPTMSVPAIASRRRDRLQLRKVEGADDVKKLTCRRVMERLRNHVVPVPILLLKTDKNLNGVRPAPVPRTPVLRRFRGNRLCRGLASIPKTFLPFSIGKGHGACSMMRNTVLPTSVVSTTGVRPPAIPANYSRAASRPAATDALSGSSGEIRCTMASGSIA